MKKSILYLFIASFLFFGFFSLKNAQAVVSEDVNGEAVFCTLEYAPVCGENGVTYSNTCFAEAANQNVAYQGECDDEKTIEDEVIEDEIKDENITRIFRNVGLFIKNNIQAVLSEIKEVRNTLREEAVEKNQLRTLSTEMKRVSETARESINAFVAYGVDENTKKLGEGERAAVIHSFREAFGKLPETEDELVDVIKIANGRWPGKTNQEAELKARKMFEKIYKREVDEENQHDMSAIKIMAYGLRQRAENRNLNSERKGIEIFKNIFNNVPQTTEDWNVMQAITYSGATR